MLTRKEIDLFLAREFGEPWWSPWAERAAWGCVVSVLIYLALRGLL